MLKSVTVDWMEKWGNSPRFVVEADSSPSGINSPGGPWTRRGEIHLRPAGDFVTFFATNGRPNGGYGGARFAGAFEDGTAFEYVGAWSSRPGAANKLFPEHLSVDAVLGHLAVHVRADAILEWRASHDADWGLAWVVEPNGERTLEPTRGGRLKRPPLAGSVVSHVALRREAAA